MIAKGIRNVWQRRRKRKPGDQTWKQIDKSRIPLSGGRIWLADNEGNVRRALAWTWPILNRREPRKYKWWMARVDRAREPTPEALAALNTLRQAPGAKGTLT